MMGHPIDRRRFLGGLAGSLVSGIAFGGPGSLLRQQGPVNRSCWLNLCVPFVVDDPAEGLVSEILLTSPAFPGLHGYTEESYRTEYELLLYDSRGDLVRAEKPTDRVIPPMQPTVVAARELLPRRQSFFGGLRVRVRPLGSGLHHLGDMFSAAFARWQHGSHSTYVHAHPDPFELASGQFCYSIPFPALADHACQLVLFSPTETASEGKLSVYDREGNLVRERDYRLSPHASVLFSLSTLEFEEGPLLPPADVQEGPESLRRGGSVALVNTTPEAKAFAYLLMRGRGTRTFSVEHPLHQGYSKLSPARSSPYDEQGSFAAESLLFTPLVFSGFKVAGLELNSRFTFSAGYGLEEALWLMPFVTLPDGNIAWVADRDPDLQDRIEPALADQKLVRLNTFQNCVLDAVRLPLPGGFAGGLGLATVPATHHTLMKPEVAVPGWSKGAFTHFRPGGATARKYRDVPRRGGIATDYIISGARILHDENRRKHDCLLAIMNIEFQSETEGNPEIEVFGHKGLLARNSMGSVPALGCRHLLLSELLPKLNTDEVLTVRLVDRNAMMIMSAVHLDYEGQNLSIDHGSDRHSTYNSYGC